MGLSNQELVERRTQLSTDCTVAIASAEATKKNLDKIAEETWQNIVTILKKDLKKDQTPDQAFDELMGIGRVSEKVLENIKASTAGFETVGKIASWFCDFLGTPSAINDGLIYVGLGIGAYVKTVAQPGLEAAQAATVLANETLAAFERRAEFNARVLGPNVAAQAVQRQILLRNAALAAEAQEARLAGRVLTATKWASRSFKLGFWGLVTAACVNAAADFIKNVAEEATTEEIKRSVHWIYTSRFYMNVQLRYLQFLEHHISQIEILTAFLAKGDANAAATVLNLITSHAVELDPVTNQVKEESIKQFSWSEEVVAADLAKDDNDKKQNTADDPTKEQRVEIHKEQLKMIEEDMKKEEEEAHAAAAAAAGAKHN